MKEPNLDNDTMKANFSWEITYPELEEGMTGDAVTRMMQIYISFVSKHIAAGSMDKNEVASSLFKSLLNFGGP